jgi:hypothetical protein
VTVEDGAHPKVATDPIQNLIRDLGVGLIPPFSRRVEAVERLCGAVQSGDPGNGSGIGEQIEDLVRLLDVPPRILSCLMPELDAGPNDDKRSPVRLLPVVPCRLSAYLMNR